MNPLKELLRRKNIFSFLLFCAITGLCEIGAQQLLIPRKKTSNVARDASINNKFVSVDQLALFLSTEIESNNDEEFTKSVSYLYDALPGRKDILIAEDSCNEPGVRSMNLKVSDKAKSASYNSLNEMLDRIDGQIKKQKIKASSLSNLTTADPIIVYEGGYQKVKYFENADLTKSDSYLYETFPGRKDTLTNQEDNFLDTKGHQAEVKSNEPIPKIDKKVTNSLVGENAKNSTYSSCNEIFQRIDFTRSDSYLGAIQKVRTLNDGNWPSPPCTPLYT